MTISLVGARKKQIDSACISNQKNIGIAHRISSTDSSARFLMEKSTNDGGTFEYATVAPHFRALSNELGGDPKILNCQTSRRLPATDFQSLQDSNISYFIGLRAEGIYPQTVLGGDIGFTVNGRVPATNRIQPTLNTSLAYPKVVHRGHGILLFGDGSVRQLKTQTFNEIIRNTGKLTNVFLLP